MRQQVNETAFFLAVRSPPSGNTNDIFAINNGGRQARAAGMLRQKHGSQSALTKP
jgi:hypothetical protein